MSERKRKSFSADFKAKVALEAIHGVKTLNEIAQEHGVQSVQESSWKKELQQQAASLFEQKRGPKLSDPLEDPEKLYSEIGRLKMELKWIKKVRRESRVLNPSPFVGQLFGEAKVVRLLLGPFVCGDHRSSLGTHR